MKFFVALAVFVMSVIANASPCTVVHERLAASPRFEAIGLHGSSARTEMSFELLTDLWNGSTYGLKTAGTDGPVQVSTLGAYCSFHSLDETSYFHSGVEFAISTPDAKGRCGLLKVDVTNIVGHADAAKFVAGGLCLTPISTNAVIVILGATVLVPAN